MPRFPPPLNSRLSSRRPHEFHRRKSSKGSKASFSGCEVARASDEVKSLFKRPALRRSLGSYDFSFAGCQKRSVNQEKSRMKAKMIKQTLDDSLYTSRKFSNLCTSLHYNYILEWSLNTVEALHFFILAYCFLFRHLFLHLKYHFLHSSQLKEKKMQV